MMGRRSPARDKKIPPPRPWGEIKPPCRSDKGDGTGFQRAEPQFHSPVLAGSWNDGEAGDLALPARMRPRGPGLSCIRGRDYSCGTAPASPPEGALGRTTGLPLFSPAFRLGHLTGVQGINCVGKVYHRVGELANGRATDHRRRTTDHRRRTTDHRRRTTDHRRRTTDHRPRAIDALPSGVIIILSPLQKGCFTAETQRTQRLYPQDLRGWERGERARHFQKCLARSEQDRR